MQVWSSSTLTTTQKMSRPASQPNVQAHSHLAQRGSASTLSRLWISTKQSGNKTLGWLLMVATEGCTPATCKCREAGLWPCLGGCAGTGGSAAVFRLHPKAQEPSLQTPHPGSPDLLLSKLLQGCDEHLAGILNLMKKSRRQRQD